MASLLGSSFFAPLPHEKFEVSYVAAGKLTLKMTGRLESVNGQLDKLIRRMTMRLAVVHS